MVADELAERWGLTRERSRFKGRLAEGRLPGGATSGSQGRPPRVALLRPETFMNDVGRSVGPARGHFKLPLERVLVIHDEIDLPFGEVRSRLGGGLAGHNGLRSLKRALGGSDFWRVRLGVGRPPSTDPEIVAAYVLAPFSEPPAEIRELILRGSEAAERVILEESGS
jgi:peptidyl-tRNA hydrolase, PTH1 family